MLGGPYGKNAYGHVALRVQGENDDGAYDFVYDFGRYGKTWGIGNSEGEGMLRIWSNFDDYIKGENATGRTTTGYVFAISNDEAGRINAHFSSITEGIQPSKVRGSMQQFRLATDYHAANCNCATVALDGLRAGRPSLSNALNQNRFDRGRGLSWLENKSYTLSKQGNGVRLPLDLQAAADSYGKAIEVNTYKW
ncbi:hypothetical protein ACL7TT_19725 [Microbulbifer sp. 2304DJ12-6]|uniref:hypothetical protein n=1 Tax=Microbulbifer sp. 2304DJ12-6 TaxID=3233340 RepID=UPI0039AF0CD4